MPPQLPQDPIWPAITFVAYRTNVLAIIYFLLSTIWIITSLMLIGKCKKHIFQCQPIIIFIFSSSLLHELVVNVLEHTTFFFIFIWLSIINYLRLIFKHCSTVDWLKYTKRHNWNLASAHMLYLCTCTLVAKLPFIWCIRNELVKCYVIVRIHSNVIWLCCYCIWFWF